MHKSFLKNGSILHTSRKGAILVQGEMKGKQVKVWVAPHMIRETIETAYVTTFIIDKFLYDDLTFKTV